MKIESAKSNNQIQHEKEKTLAKEKANDGKLLEDSSKLSNTKKDFAEILRGSSEQQKSLFEPKNKEKSIDQTKIDSETNESKTNSSEQKKVREEKREKSDSDEKNDSEKEKAVGQIQVQNQQNNDELTVPKARVIVHIADLERIISKIRTQNFKDGKLITIELKRSIFEGLKLKLSIGKDNNITAEFLAANENIKSQLNARSDELASLLKNRGVKLSKVKMSLDSQNDENNKDRQRQIEQIGEIKSSPNSKIKDDQTLNPTIGTNTSYQA